MKFGDWVHHQKGSKIDSKRKTDLYRSILIKKRFNSSFSKTLHRSFFGVFLASVILMCAVFLYNDVEKSYWNIDIIGEGYVGVSRDDNSGNAVYADAIGEIIETKGGVQLYHNGEEVGLDQVRDSDRILLQKDSEIVFVLSDDVQAKIAGPAEFELYEEEGGYYVINMLYGDLVELLSVTNDDSNAQENIIPATNIQNTSDKEFYVVVKTEDYEVTSPSNLEKIDLVLQGDGEKNIIHNIGDRALIKKAIDDEYIVKDLNSEQIASIEGDISIFDGRKKTDTIEDVNLSDLKIVYNSSINLDDIKIIENDEPEEDTIVLAGKDEPSITQNTGSGGVSAVVEQQIDAQEEYINTDELFNDDDVSIVSLKRVMSPAQSKVFSSAISSSSMLDACRQILSNTYIGNAAGLSTNLNKVKKSFDAISTAFGLGINVDASSVSSLLDSVDVVQTEINEKYYIAPSFDANFGVVKHRLSITNGVGFGSANDCDLDCLTNSTQLTPAQRVFLKGQ